jgi:Zn-finger nucleic acid-binding protein
MQSDCAMDSTAVNAVARPFEARLPCPICVGVQMEKIVLGRPGKLLVLDHCSRCGGVWFEKGETQRLTWHTPNELWKLVPPRSHVIRPPCHGCGTPLGRDDRECPVCSRANELQCPACDVKAARVTVDGITLDVCERCKGVWFDHEELRSIWKLKLTDIARNRSVNGVGDGTGVLFEALIWAPDIAFYGAHAVVSGLAHTAGAVGDLAKGGGADAASGVLGAIGEAGESVFDAIASILGGLFE